MADRLSPSLHGESVLAAVEMHHNGSRIGHQWLLAHKHCIRWNLASRPLYAWSFFTRSLLASFCSVFCSLGSWLVMPTCGLLRSFLRHCCCLSCQSIMLELSSTKLSVAS